MDDDGKKNADAAIVTPIRRPPPPRPIPLPTATAQTAILSVILQALADQCKKDKQRDKLERVMLKRLGEAVNDGDRDQDRLPSAALFIRAAMRGMI